MSALDEESACRVVFADGSTGRAVGCEGEVIAMICDRAHPPGRPLELSLRAGETTLALRGKSAGSKRRDDGHFDVRLRLHSLKREDRDALACAFGPRSSRA